MTASDIKTISRDYEIAATGLTLEETRALRHVLNASTHLGQRAAPVHTPIDMRGDCFDALAELAIHS